MVETILCELCGAETKHPVRATINGRSLNFCCTGCLRVYELQSDQAVPGVPSGRAAPAVSQTEQESPADVQSRARRLVKTVTLPIVGMTCASCVSHVQKALKALGGVQDAVVNLDLASALVTYIPNVVSVNAMVRAVREIGYDVQEFGTGADALG